MTAVFVNGNPENDAIWSALVPLLGCDDVRLLSPPGFGASVPEGFTGTVEAMRTWLVAELEAFDEPVDLVGHDIGGSTVLTVAMSRPDLLRSWVSDSLGVFDPDYTWHDLAQVWQTPGRGEESVAQWMGGTLESRRDRVRERIGTDERTATDLVAAQGDEMGRAILAFYRSAVQPKMARLGERLGDAAARPGLAVIGTADHFVGTEAMRCRAATRAGAQTLVLDGVGHWWMVQAPQLVAEALESFWATL